MAGQGQLELERASRAAKDSRALDATPKTILVHIHDDDTLDARLESALSLARSFSAHLECMHVTPGQAYVAYDSFGGIFVMKMSAGTMFRRPATSPVNWSAAPRLRILSWPAADRGGSNLPGRRSVCSAI